MIKYITIENTGSLFKFDTETEQIETIPTQREAIRSISLIKEPGVLVNKDTETPVNNGDLVIRFYEQYFNKSAIIVKSEDWKNNLDAYNKKMEEDRKQDVNEMCDAYCERCEPVCAKS